jgi:hypothetical protein
MTSVRRDGRAPRGFSGYLRALDTTGVHGRSAGPGGGLDRDTAGARR